MSKPNVGYDHHRYRKLLAEATDETKRLAFIDLLIEEQARDRLAAQRAATLTTIIGRPGTVRDDWEEKQARLVS